MKIYRPGKEKGTYKILVADGLFLSIIEGVTGKGQARITLKLTPEEAAALAIFLKRMAEDAIMENYNSRKEERTTEKRPTFHESEREWERELKELI